MSGIRTIQRDEVAAILSHLSDINHTILGGAGMMTTGLPRETGDLDVLVAPEDLHAAVARLGEQGRVAEKIGNEFMHGFLVEVPTSPGEEPLQVDVVTADEPWVAEALFESRGGEPSKPWLFASKTFAMREKNLEDVFSLWASMSPGEKQRTEQIISKHIPWAMDELETAKMMDEAESFVAASRRIMVKAWVRRQCKLN